MIFGFEITTGSIMFFGGIALAALTIVFAVIYLSPNDEEVVSEIENVRTACDNYTDSPIKLSIAMGYASGTSDPSGFMEIYSKADALMYENKAEIKRKHPEFCR